jgi:hypothetical protein
MRCIPLVVLALAACAVDVSDDLEVEQEDADFIVEPDDGKADGLPPTFDANNVVSDKLLVDGTAMSTSKVQAFLDRTPYGTRSWLASYRESGTSAAEMIVAAATTHDVNPVVLLARMQVETSLVSKTTTPQQRLINRALGCGCPDGGACNTAYSGLRKQLDCGARTMRRWYDASVAGTGQWRKGVARSTLDPRRVVPANHATASLYAYTPWVLVGRGGNWLAWNVTRKYVRDAQARGLIASP